MKNANLNNTIKFIDKKAEYEERKTITKINLHKLKNKGNKVIKYQERKKIKSQEAKKEKIKNSKVFKSKKTILTVIFLLSLLFTVYFLWSKLYKPSYTTSTEYTFKVESQNLSRSETSSYETIVKKSVKKILKINYIVTVDQLHRNGNLIFAQGHFNIPEEGNVYYDMMLKEYSPYSLKINGDEYIKK